MKQADKKKITAGASIESLEKKALDVKKQIHEAYHAREKGTVKNTRLMGTLKKQYAFILTVKQALLLEKKGATV